MSNNRSRQVTSRVMLLMSSGLLFVSLAWIGFRVFQPVDVPPPAPGQNPISFNANQEIAKDSLFAKLQLFVRGEYRYGNPGNPYPLGGNPKKKTPKGYDNKALLATATEVPLNGVFVQDISLNKDGGILMLLQNLTSDGQLHYEIRTNGMKEDHSIAQWNAAPRPDLRVAGIAQDAQGQVWMLNEKGQVGKISSGSPSWMTSLSTGLSALDAKKLAISADSLDRVWLMDGYNVSVGGEKGFTPVDVSAELTTDQRTAYETILSSQVQELGFQSLDGVDAYLRSSLVPKKFYPLPDGRMGLVMAEAAMIFPQSQTARVTWIPTAQHSMTPYGISHDGAVWGSRYTDHTMLRVLDDEEHVFDAGPAPATQAFNVQAMAFMDDEAFVFEQASNLTNLWYSDGRTWGAKLVSVTGTQAIVASPLKIQAEEDGTIWSLMTDGHLYRITAGASVEAPAPTNL